MTGTIELGDLVERLRTGNTNHIDADLWMADAAALIEELEAQIKKDALQYLSDTGQMGEAIGDLTRRHQHALHKIDVLEDGIDELRAKLDAAERRERQLLDTTATCRMLRRELNTAKAKLAEVEASSQGWIDAAVEQQVRRKRAEARLLEVEAERDMARIQTGEKE